MGNAKCETDVRHATFLFVISVGGSAARAEPEIAFHLMLARSANRRADEVNGARVQPLASPES